MTGQILVVDDLLPNIKLLEALLTNEYYDVLTARSGKEALALLETKKPDIILLDVMMPEMDGYEVCRRLKANAEWLHIPVVMVTALSEVASRVEGLKSGADDFLTKPINDLALFARIRSLLRLKQITDELKLRNRTGVEFGVQANSILTGGAPITNAHIILLDDDKTESKRIAERLIKLQHKVIIVEKAPDLLPSIQTIPTDLIIVSTQLSDADGLRVCSQLRSQAETRPIPLLMLIEEEDTRTLVKGLDMGVNDYLVIPIDMNELEARTTAQIRRKRYQDLLKEKYQHNVELAMMDGLTGVYNRRYFDSYLGNKMQIEGEFKPVLTLFILDIDHFKSVNDTYGHITGDEVLKEIVKRIQGVMRPVDLIARFGGEEFVVIIPEGQLAMALSIGERIRANIANTPIVLTTSNNTSLQCTISIGLTSFRNGDNAEIMLKRADEALYEAKETGRNKVVSAKEEEKPEKTS